MKTYSPKEADIERKWFVVDADGQVLGRLASTIAKIVRGKHKPMWAPHMDVGDFIVVVNANKIRLTGRKEEQMNYYRYSGYPGGLNKVPYSRMKENRPEFIVYEAIRRMLPHNRLGRKMMRKVKIYASPEHPHNAQKPEKLEL